jgi:glycosyltransferase involved in cell wall biosynthesis
LNNSISIGIPFYNAESYLADAIRSIFAQTYQDWELILVDDGSTDRSLEIACSVKDPRVRVISDGQNRRLPYRLNQITAEAKYELVGRMDADDLISPRRFEKQIEILNENPRVDLVTTGIWSIRRDRSPIGVRIYSPEISGRGLLLGKHPICHAAIAGRKKWFLRNPYDINRNTLSEDYELWVRAFSKNDLNIHLISEPLYYYREEHSVRKEKILGSYAHQRRCYKEYGNLWFKRWEIPILTIRSYMKTSIVRILSASGRLDLLLSKRSSLAENNQLLETYNRDIKYISRVKIPGIDS